MPRKLFIIKTLQSGLRARDLDTGEIISLKTTESHECSELETITFESAKEWTFKKHLYASGTILDHQLQLENLSVPALEHTNEGLWDPHESFGDEADEYFPEYLREGLREEFLFNDYSGYGFYAENNDPVMDAVEAETPVKRYDILTKLWIDFPQCIDALVHIANSYSESSIFGFRAYNLYKAAVYIAEQNLPDDFDGLFLWIHIENRPYLRALHGLCLMQWKLADFPAALATAEKLLRICPTDNIGVRFLIPHLRENKRYDPQDWE
jgi:hypothetical protein